MNPCGSLSKSNLGTSRSIPPVNDFTLEDSGVECLLLCGMCVGVDPIVGVINPFVGVGTPPTGVKDPEDLGVTLAVLIWGVFLGV